MTVDWNDDETLMQLLRSAMSPARVPPEVIEAGYAAFSWRAIDAELAALTFDSATQDLAGAGTRASQRARIRVLTFSSNTLSIEIEVGDEALLGQIVPTDAGSLTVFFRDGRTAAPHVDALGCFALAPVPTGPFKLQVNGDVLTSTDWITV
jgi:hypothetical protein